MHCTQPRRTHVPLKYTIVLKSELVRNEYYVLTFDTMLLHGSDLLQRKTKRVNHKDSFGNVDVVNLVELQCDNEQGEENKEAQNG